ncbi:tyrosine-type recombinase/integrase [Actinomadura sediminis]|uniref:Tyrosine-type recombinase/integrase n=1 Tax=Actinomadura sediminis TaxID=1038904 RepID=A0ABW3ESB4_9ACTN
MADAPSPDAAPEEPPAAPCAADDLLELLPSWHRDMLNDGASPLTLKTYGQSVRTLAAHLAALDDPPATMEDITREHIKDWLTAMREAGLKESTRSTKFANCRAFFNWLVAEDELPASPMDGVKQPSVKDQPVPVVAREGVLAMLDGCDNTYEGRRDEAIIRSFADGGMRVGELTKLTVDDVDMEQQVFWVHGKGGRKRAVPFGAKTARAVDRYLRARRRHPKARTTDRLFLSRVGPISVDRVEKMIAQRAEAAGLGHLYPHQLRHTAAHQLRLAGMNDQDMKRIFGWRSSRMLERYGASAADERAREAHRRLSFGDQL